MRANDLINDVRQIFTQREITVTACNGKNYTLLIDNKFKKEKITQLISGMVERAHYCKKNDIQFDYTICLWVLIIKNFTDIKFINHKNFGKCYENEIDVLKAMINLEIVEEIMDSFDPKEMNKITELSKSMAQYVSYMHQVEVDQILEKLIDEIPDDEVVERDGQELQRNVKDE